MHLNILRERQIFNPNEADNVRTNSKILCQLIINHYLQFAVKITYRK